jgi:transposase
MRGDDQDTGAMFSYVSPEARVRPDHPLRPIRQMTDAALQRLSPRFYRMYSDIGRPSIPPEKLLRALLLQMLYTIRSERLLMEELDYSVLFRWFVGLGMDDPVWDATTFTKNRDRLLAGDIADAFFQEVLAAADRAGLASDEHFTVDGTLLEAWASQKSFRQRDTPADPPDGPGNPTVNFRGEARRNDTHQSTTDPDARLYKKSSGREAKLVRDTRAMGITPQVAQYAKTPHRRSAIDGRTTRHPGYALSQQKRKLVEQAFGWMKTIGLLRKLRHRGGPRVNWIFTFAAAAYNLVRLRTLLAQPA